MTSDRKDHGNWSGLRVLVLSPTPTHPQDYGNRKRIFQVCRNLQQAGAEISFAHYPSEAEWRQSNPWDAERAMVAEWSQYFTVPPTREVHPDAKGVHHTIDEWWDESIGNFLRWLFAAQTFDVFIVNYAWLSKAFEYAPPSVVKILDTHDKKAGRGEMLTSHGIAPEYFHTTEAQEKLALDRADLVWAIKDQERIAFEGLTARPVLTLPHLDPAHALKRPEFDPEGYLRVGVLAARNNINRVNITNFLQIADPIFSAAFAPIKIVIAGSVCDMLGDITYPFVESRGRVTSADDFYRTVDCAAIPMTFSTGLKIKAAEALSAGVPVVSTAHGFEGFDAADPMHTLPDFPALAEALVELSFAPRGQLADLARASAVVQATTSALIAESLERTLEYVREHHQSVVLAVDSRAFLPGTPFNLLLRSVHEYLHKLGNPSVLVVKGSAAHIAGADPLINEIGRVVVAADLEDSEKLRSQLAAMHVETAGVEQYLSERRIKVLIADALHDDFYKPCCAETTLFARLEMIALSEGRTDFHLPGEAFRRAFIVAPRTSREVASAQAEVNGSLALVPCINRVRELMPRLKSDDEEAHILLLGSPQTRAMKLARCLADAWHMNTRTVSGLDAMESERHGVTSSGDYVEDLVAGKITAPLFALDVSGGQLGLQLCRELLERLGVPVVTAGFVGVERTLGTDVLPVSVTTEFELYELFRSFAMNPEFGGDPAFHVARASLGSDRGWAYLGGFCTRLFATRDPEFA